MEIMLGVLGGAIGGVVTTLLAIYKTHLFDADDVVADANAVRTIRHLLKHEKLPWRSFAMIQHYIGGYSENELRRLLVRAGAVRAMSADEREVWALWSRIVKRYRRKDALPWKLKDELKANPDSDLFPSKLRSPFESRDPAN